MKATLPSTSKCIHEMLNRLPHFITLQCVTKFCKKNSVKKGGALGKKQTCTANVEFLLSNRKGADADGMLRPSVLGLDGQNDLLIISKR